MKKFTLLFIMFFTVLTLAACNRGSSYKGLDTDIEGEITIMLWSGDNQLLEDVGRTEIAASDLAGQNQATIYAVAQAFNEIYPNVQINVFAVAGGPEDNDTSWYQKREAFRDREGYWPDIYASTDLIGDMSRGLVADLSRFEDDPLYQSFNESIMDMMNYYGFQAGLPQYLLPWGVYVNKDLAESNNLDVPNPDWTIAEYTNFISQGDNTNFWGAMDANVSFINTGTTSINYRLANYDGEGDHVDINSDEVKYILDNYYQTWANNAVWPQYDNGSLTDDDMAAEFGWWDYNGIINNKLLTLAGSPWMMGDAAHPDPNHWGAMQSSDWDIYPRPSTPYQDNTVGIVLDPLAIHNYCEDDGDSECSDEELEKLQIAYTFASFWVGDTRAWQARADQEFNDQGIMKSAMNDSFPFVTGSEFDRQMEIWYSVPIHQRFADADLMPGFQKVLEIYEAGQFWDVSDKAYPYFVTDEGGTRVENMLEWNELNDAERIGALRTDSDYTDSVTALLADWNTRINQRFLDSREELRQALIEYYGYSESDFE
jgi:ABC-type glycerol-3-phosphate transport system substrate-binding protein